MKKVSLAEVAESLGVSKTLVSLVLNNKGNEYGISSDTQLRVRKRAEELNYYPNQIAKTLRTKRSNTIGLIVADISNEFYSRIAKSIEQKALAEGYHVIFSSSEEDARHEEDLIHLLKDKQQADGLIIATTQKTAAKFRELQKQEYPFVFIDRYLEDFEANSVTVDNKAGSSVMLDYLLSKGCKRIALLAISPSHISTIRDRVQGFHEHMQAKGIKVQQELVKEIPHTDIQANTDRALEELLSLKEQPDAIFALNNQLALACLSYFSSSNKKKPLLVSFDDIDTFKLVKPPVPAIMQPTELIGEHAVKQLLEMIAKPSEHIIQNTVLPVKLTER